MCSSDLNKASADVELQSFDRRVAALQKSIQYKIDNELLKVLGFDLINFCFDKASKRDEVRELERVNLMKGIRSEERRVGKECRCRWWAGTGKKERV